MAAFAISSLLAGGNAVAIRFSNRELDPLWGASLRFALAAVILAGVMVVLRPGLPRGRALIGTMLYGVFNFAGAFGLAYFGLLRIQAGLGQTLLALVPLATLLLAVLERQERVRLRAVGGALIALAGIAVMTRAPVGEALPLVSWLALVGSAFCFAQAAVFVRRFPPVHPVTMNGVAMATGAVILFLGSLIAGDAIELPDRAATWLALLYVVVVGSVVVFLLYLMVLRHWAATRAACTFVVIPLVTVLLSAWLDRERISIAFVIGGLLVLIGVYVGALRDPGTSGRPAARSRGESPSGVVWPSGLPSPEVGHPWIPGLSATGPGCSRGGGAGSPGTG